MPSSEPMILGLAEIPTLEGRTLTGAWWRLDPERVRLFERATYLDLAYAGHVPMPDVYPENLLEGFYSLALIDYMLRELWQVNDEEGFALNYGIDRVRFPARVTWDDEIRFTVSFPTIEQRPPGYLLVYDGAMEVRRGGDRPAMIAAGRIMYLPRDAPPAPRQGSAADTVA